MDLETRLERHFAKLGTIGIQSDGSISRIAYSDEESAAMAYIRAEGESFGLEGGYDPIGNLILRTPGEHPRRMITGSHLDSVPHGGNYDGAAGVVAGLEALRELAAERVPADLVVWRGEEYTFNSVYKGSAGAFGLGEPHILHNVFRGQSLRDAILRQQFDPSYIDAGKPSLEGSYIDSLAGYIELHIEQGVRLEQEGLDLGVVTSIAGDRRFLIVLEGRFDHSGATPMGVRYRSDVNLAMAYMQTGIDALAAERREQGHQFVQTVGIINADPEIDRKVPEVHSNSVTKVSGLAYFTLDIMSPDDTFMDEYAAEVHRLIWKVAREYGVKAVIDETDNSRGLPELDGRIRKGLEDAVRELGYSYIAMPSGAGHDAVPVESATRSDGSRIPVGMLFVPCRNGISHSKDEFVEMGHLAKGVRVLRDGIRRLMQGGTD